MPSKPDAAVARLREICLALSDTFEKVSHGEPSWFVKDRVFAMLDDHHHGAERLAVGCNAPDGAQKALVEAEPKHFFVPPYVGKAGWVGIRLDTGLGWPAITAIVSEAHAATMAKRKRRR